MENNLNNKIVFCLLAILPISIVLGSTISLIVIILISISFLYFSVINKEFSWIKDPYFKLLSVIFIYLLFNSLLSVSPENSIARNLGFLRYVLFVFAIKYFFKKNKNYKIIFLIWTLTILIISFDVYYEFYNKGDSEIYGRRIVSFFKDEPVVGGFLYSFLFIILGFLFNEKLIPPKLKILGYIVPFAIFVAILLTTERSNTIKALTGLLFFFLIFEKIPINKKIIFLTIFITSIVSLFSFSDNLKYKYYEQFFKQIKSENNIKYYVENNLYTKHYKAGYEIFKKKPFFGVGNKNFSKVCYAIPWKTVSEKGMICSSHPHQIYLELLAEHGIIGTLIILYIIFNILWSNIKNYLRFKNPIHFATMIYVILSFLPLLPTGSFFGNFNSTLFWMNFALMLAFEKENSIRNNEYNKYNK